MHRQLTSLREVGSSRALLLTLTFLLMTCAPGCADFFNPSFVNIFAGSGSDGDAAFTSVDPPTGHVPLLFRNSARIAENVFRYVIQNDAVVRPEVVDELLRVNPQLSRQEVENILQGVIDDDPSSPVDLEGVNIPPRVRLTVLVTNVDGGVQVLEFLDGLRIVRTENIGGAATGNLPPDLTENTNSTFIVQCDIQRIEISRIDVFVPIVLRTTQNIFDEDGFIVGRECIQFDPPSFELLMPDEVFDNEQGEFTVKRNFDPRFFPPALEALQCGAVVILELTGTLSMPFGDEETNCLPPARLPADGFIPTVLNTDQLSQDLIPGIYAVRTIIRN